MNNNILNYVIEKQKNIWEKSFDFRFNKSKPLIIINNKRIIQNTENYKNSKNII